MSHIWSHKSDKLFVLRRYL